MSEYTQEEQAEAFKKTANIKILYLVQILKMINISCSRGTFAPNELSFIGSLHDLISQGVEQAMIKARNELKIKNGIVDVKVSAKKDQEQNQTELSEILEKFKEQQEQIQKLTAQLQQEKQEKQQLHQEKQLQGSGKIKGQNQNQNQNQNQDQGLNGLPEPLRTKPTKQRSGKQPPPLPEYLQPKQTKITNDQSTADFERLQKEYEGLEEQNTINGDYIYDPDVTL